jgi:hypothetical protein
VAIEEPTVKHDGEAEQELEVVLRSLVALALERPGGVTVEELARRIGLKEYRHVRELLERGRLVAVDGAGDRRRPALVERVHEEYDAYWRSRYVPTPAALDHANS